MSPRDNGSSLPVQRHRAIGFWQATADVDVGIPADAGARRRSSELHPADLGGLRVEGNGMEGGDNRERKDPGETVEPSLSRPLRYIHHGKRRYLFRFGVPAEFHRWLHPARFATAPSGMLPAASRPPAGPASWEDCEGTKPSAAPRSR